MKQLKNTKTLVVAALMCAFTCVATMSIQIPTPTLGYIHPGDCLVLLCGVILGPVIGPVSAGIGSMLADLLSGYVIYAIPTLVIKGVTALIAAVVFHKLKKVWHTKQTVIFIVAGLLGELNMSFGYFINKIVKTMFLAGSYTSETFAAGLTAAISGIVPDIIQGSAGIILGVLLLPILSQIPDVRIWLNPGLQTKSQQA